jgi:hypothetical protein
MVARDLRSFAFVSTAPISKDVLTIAVWANYANHILARNGFNFGLFDFVLNAFINGYLCLDFSPFSPPAITPMLFGIFAC